MIYMRILEIIRCYYEKIVCFNENTENKNCLMWMSWKRSNPLLNYTIVIVFDLYVVKIINLHGWIDDMDVFNHRRRIRTQEEIEKQNLLRTKRNIRELALCNNFEYFVTLTLNSANADRFSLSSCQDVLRKSFKAYKRKNSAFHYLFITEKHEKRFISFSRSNERYYT